MPDWLLMFSLNLSGYIGYNLGIGVPALKAKADNFGSIMLTNVSGIGFKEAYAPLVNWCRNLAVAVIGTPYWQMTCDDDGTNQRMEKVFNWMQTTDHRYLDGAVAGVLSKGLYQVWANPEAFDKPYEVLNKEHRYMSTCKERAAFTKSEGKS